MLACKHCSTSNSLDSTFCKKCGTAVPSDQKREATLQLDKLIDEGLSALNAGRSAEALAIADAAIATDPTHLGALQLKSTVHERRGEIADALQSAERIVELNPDSELDRIKRNGLRTSLLNATAPVAPNRSLAFAAAAAAMVLVACAGVLIARKPGEAPAVPTVASNDAPIVEPSVFAPPTQAESAPAAAPQAAAKPNEVVVGDSRLPTRDPGMSAELPPANGRIGDTEIKPYEPNVGGTLPPAGGTGSGAAPSNNPPKAKPPVAKTDRDADPNPDPLPPSAGTQEDAGQIEISVSKVGGPRKGGGQMIPETRTNGSTAYARVGTERFGLGDYAGAATNLEKAVAGGGDAVGLNLRLAQAYSRLGRNSDAAAAYERSRAAADSALAGGKGNKELLTEQRATADAGLKTVRG